MSEALTDNELVLQIRQNQAEAFNVLTGRYQARMRAMAAQYVPIVRYATLRQGLRSARSRRVFPGDGPT